MRGNGWLLECFPYWHLVQLAQTAPVFPGMASVEGEEAARDKIRGAKEGLDSCLFLLTATARAGLTWDTGGRS
jgi:hypothetical protein